MSSADAPVEPTPVSRALDALGIPYRLFRHAGPVHTLEQAAEERGQRPEQVVLSRTGDASGHLLAQSLSPRYTRLSDSTATVNCLAATAL